MGSGMVDEIASACLILTANVVEMAIAATTSDRCAGSDSPLSRDDALGYGSSSFFRPAVRGWRCVAAAPRVWAKQCRLAHLASCISVRIDPKSCAACWQGHLAAPSRTPSYWRGGGDKLSFYQTGLVEQVLSRNV